MVEGSFLKRKEKIEGIWALGAQMAKNPPAMRETWVRSLCWKDPLEKGSATHSSIVAWRIPWTEEPGRLQSMGLQRVRHDWVTFNHLDYQEGRSNTVSKNMGKYSRFSFFFCIFKIKFDDSSHKNYNVWRGFQCT